MQTRIALLSASLLLAGCPSGGGDPKDATTSSSASSSGSGTAGTGTGPLAGLETSPFMNEVWIGEDGQQTQFLYYARENVRVSAQCRQPNGTIACDALRYLRTGTPIEIPHRVLDGRQSAGVKVCAKLNQPIVVFHNSVGSEDSMCKFPDGSLVATGALEHYGMRISE